MDPKSSSPSDLYDLPRVEVKTGTPNRKTGECWLVLHRKPRRFYPTATEEGQIRGETTTTFDRLGSVRGEDTVSNVIGIPGQL